MATVSNTNGQLEFKQGNRTEFYQFVKLSNVTWVLNNDGNHYVLLTYEDDYFVKIKLLDVTNQPGWTNDLVGAEQAVKDISTWIGIAIAPSVGLATEATLLNVLSAVDNMRDYEVRLVEDSDTPKVTWLEVRYWDAQSGALGTPVYYLPGSTTAGSPVLPISYINNQTLLTQILAELQGTLDVNVTNAVISVSQSGAWTVTANQGTSPWVISGTVNVGNFPATQNVAVTSIVEVEVKNDTGNPLPVTGTVTITDGSGPVTVDGTVTANQGTSPWIVDTTATTRTPALIRATGSGTISAGARSISVFNAGAAAGSILGVASNILPGEVFEFSAGGENDTLSAFAYDGTGTTLVITSIV